MSCGLDRVREKRLEADKTSEGDCVKIEEDHPAQCALSFILKGKRVFSIKMNGLICL